MAATARARWQWASALVLCLCGCGDAPLVSLDRWTLAVDGVSSSVQLPARLDRSLVPARARHFTLSTTVELPPNVRGSAIELVVPDLAGIPKLVVDGGAPATPNGSNSFGYNSRGPHIWPIPAAATTDGVVELRLEIDNTWTQSSWLTTVPRLVPAGMGTHSAGLQGIVNVLLSACALVALFQVGITSLGVFLVDRRRRAYGYFAIQALIAAYYPFYVLGFGDRFLGLVAAPLLAASLIVAVAVAIYFTHGFFDLPAPSRRWAQSAMAACVAVAIFHGPFVATRIAGPITVAYVVVAMVYQIGVCVRLVSHHEDRTGALFMLAAWIGLALFGAPDMLAWLGVADPLKGARTGSVGLALYPLWLSLLLTRRYIKSLNQSDRLNLELAGRVEQLERRRAELERRRAEIEQLNAELRHQVAERSSQIFAALALAGQGRDVAPELMAGSIVQGRYRVVGPLGAGGMGAVYEVERLADARRFALKVARELNGVALARLAREAQIACRVTHPNIVTVVDVDVATDGFLYMVMELVEGQSLSMLRDRFGDTRWAIPILAQVADGLAALHAVEVVHRDLKPPNILLTEGASAAPLVKISDFGISLHTGHTAPKPRIDLDGEDETRDLVSPADEQSQPTVPLVASAERRPGADREAVPSLTRTGQLPGTPAYMAPELVKGREHVTPAADIFSFGVIACEMLARTRPFSESPAVSLLDSRKPQAVMSLAHLWPAAPEELVRLVDRALSLEPRRRPTAEELAAAFHALSSGAANESTA